LQPLNSEKKRKIPEGIKMEKVKIIDILEKAIIKSFSNKNSNLQLKFITKKVSELLGKRFSPDTVRKRLNKLEKNEYITRTSRGIYALNPIYDFDIEYGEPLPCDMKPIEISLEQRQNHSEDLKAAIENWISNFPNPPHLGSSYSCFLTSIEKCKKHELFSDLKNHLLISGFNVCDSWKRYKSNIKDLESFENDLLKTIEQNISEIFAGLPLKFVSNSRSMLDNYQCSIPQAMVNHYLDEYTYDLFLSSLLKKASSIQEEDEIYKSFPPSPLINDLLDIPITEENGSLVWGYPSYYADFYQLMRIPQKDRAILMERKDDVIIYIICPPSDVSERIKQIGEKLKNLDLEREAILKELKSSLYCQCFSGDCRYLGGKS
jgi:hypothetical protein